MSDKKIYIHYDFQDVARIKNLPLPEDSDEAASKRYVDTAVENVSPGGGSYEHIQNVASNTWTVNHNLGRQVAVSVLSDGGIEVFANVIHMNLNQVRVQFSSLSTGRVICS